MADLTHQEIKTLAKAVDIDIPDDLIPEVAFSLNGLLEALNQTGVEGLELSLIHILTLPTKA